MNFDLIVEEWVHGRFSPSCLERWQDDVPVLYFIFVAVQPEIRLSSV